MKIRNIATIFANECQACQINGAQFNLATPMSDYIYCYSNETNEQCCAGVR
jgi:hypothetical protein